MKKLLTLATIIAISTSVSFGATSAFSDFKKAVKQDIQNTRAEVREAVKKDIEAEKAKNQSSAQAKKAEKIKEIDKKLAELNKELTTTKKSTSMTVTEKTLKTRALERQIEFYNKQKAALK